MFISDPNWYIFFTGLGLIGLELILGVDTGFDFLLLGLSLIVGSLFGFLFDAYFVAIGISILISILYIAFGRRYIKEKLHISTHKTNIDALIDKEATVIKAISKSKAGQVKLENEIWRATSDKNLPIDSKVKVKSVEGVTLKVI